MAYFCLKHNDYSGLFNKINILKRKKWKMYTIYKATLDLETSLLELDRAYLRKGSKSNFDRQTICLRGTP